MAVVLSARYGAIVLSLLLTRLISSGQNFVEAFQQLETSVATTSPNDAYANISNIDGPVEQSPSGETSFGSEELTMGDNSFVTELPCSQAVANSSHSQHATSEASRSDVNSSIARQSPDVSTESSDVSAATAAKSASGVRLIDTGTVSAEQYEMTVTVTSSVDLGLQAVGVVVNALNVAVYLQPAMRSSCSTYLASLSLSQLFVAATAPITECARLVYGSQGVRELYYLVSGLYVSNLVQVSLLRLSFTLTLLVSFERFVAVAFPFKAGQLCLSRSPRVIVACVVVAIALAHIVIIGTKYEIFPIGSGQYSFKYSDLYSNNRFVLDTLANVLRIVFVYVLLSLTLLFNVLTTVCLRRHRKKAGNMQSSRDSSKTARMDMQTTVAILVATFLYVLCSLPVHINAIVSTFSMTHGVLKKDHYLYLLLSAIFAVLNMIAIDVNFFSYVSLSTKFRSSLRRLLWCCSSSKGSVARSPSEKRHSPREVTETTEVAKSTEQTPKCVMGEVEGA